MTVFTQGESELYSKYYGRKDLLHDEDFWIDVLILKKNELVPLPVQYDPERVRMLGLWLKDEGCRDGKCSMCCEIFKTVPITAMDIELAKEHGIDFPVVDGNMAVNPCCFLDHDNHVCTIYDCRPGACARFPVQGPLKFTVDGKENDFVGVRVLCMPGLKLIRRVFEKVAIERPEKVLLPDLNFITLVKEEVAV